MTPQERQLVDDLFDRLAKLESAPRDPDAVAAISQGLRRAPNAIYALVQTTLLQDEALKRANARIQELEGGEPEQQQSGGFLDTMRDAIFGPTPSRGSVPNVRPPEARQPPGLEHRPGVAAGTRSGTNQPGSIRPALIRPALWRAAGADGRWRRLVSGNGRSSRSRRGRRRAPDEQHPWNDGRRTSKRFWRFRRSWRRRRRASRGVRISPAAISRAMPASTISAPAVIAPMTVRAPDSSIRRRTTTTITTTWIWIRTTSTAATAIRPDARSDGHQSKRPLR